MDTLVERDCYGGYVPCLAESWETSDDGLTWTFHLRKGATWVTYTGEYYADVTAEDFITSAKYLLNAANASSTAWILTDYILNAEAYYDYTDGEGSEIAFEDVGIKALDDYTIAYTTAEPCPYFLSMMDYVCYMPVNAKFLEEKGADFGLATGPDTILYCGPYILSDFVPQEKRVYTKNETNWDAEHVYIDAIEQIYNKEAGTISPELYLRGRSGRRSFSISSSTLLTFSMPSTARASSSSMARLSPPVRAQPMPSAVHFFCSLSSAA